MRIQKLTLLLSTLFLAVATVHAGRQEVLMASEPTLSPNGKQLRGIAELVESGAVRPADFQVMRLEDAAKAQELSRAGHVRGKIVLKIR